MARTEVVLTDGVSARLRRVFSALIVTLSVATAAHGAATITMLNLDDPGEGFNDPTPVAPVGGNSGTTLGEQRLIAFGHAAELWGALLDSDVEILVGANFAPLLCSVDGATLARAGANSVHRNFAGAPISDTFYPAALANKLAGTDLCPEGSACADLNNLGFDTFDISATFNSVFGTAGCDSLGSWYLGLDADPPVNGRDFVTTVLHELAHGLGFLTRVDLETGERFFDANDVFMLHLQDNRTGRRYPEMTNEERVAASTAGGDLQWSGPNVVAASGRLTDGVDPSGRVEMFAPDPPQLGSSVSHFNTTLEPSELMEPILPRARHDVGLAAELFQDLGWNIVANPTPTPSPTPVVPTCGGDCNGDDEVTINELILGVNIALGILLASECPALDLNGDGTVAINELVTAVINASQGCPIPEGCPFDFADNTAGSEVLCVFEGHWNSSCGGDDLGASFVGDAEFLVMGLATEPAIGLVALVISSTAAELFILYPDLGDLDQFDILFGTVELADNGNTLIIDPVDPTEAPFPIDMCDFVEYRGSFTMTAPVDGGADNTTAPNVAINALRTHSSNE